MNKSWQVAIAVTAFLVIFVAGGAIGAVVMLRYGPSLPAPTALPRPEQFGPNLVRRWTNNQLNLTPDQRAKILPLIRDAAEDLRRVQSENAHSTELILEHMQDEMAVVLNPDQRNRLNELIDNWRSRSAEYRRKLQMLQQNRSGSGSGGAGN